MTPLQSLFHATAAIEANKIETLCIASEHLSSYTDVVLDADRVKINCSAGQWVLVYGRVLTVIAECVVIVMVKSDKTMKDTGWYKYPYVPWFIKFANSYFHSQSRTAHSSRIKSRWVDEPHWSVANIRIKINSS